MNEEAIRKVTAEATEQLERILAGGLGIKGTRGKPIDGTNTTPFPKRKKRGAKLRSGPCADILQFPTPLRML